MSSSEIDEYLQKLDEPRRSTLEILRQRIVEVIPDADEGLAYGVPAFRLGGKAVAGFSAAQRHLSYIPQSGGILSTLDAQQLQGFEASKGVLRMPIGTPLPAELIRTLIALRRAEAQV